MSEETAPAAGSARLGQTERLDRWLWHARFFKTRTLASRVCRAGKVRVNSARVTKASASLTVGDVLTFPQGSRIRVVRVRAIGGRRGPASEAATLYEDLTPAPPKQDTPSSGTRARGGGRPTKRDRRAIDRLRDRNGPHDDD